MIISGVVRFDGGQPVAAEATGHTPSPNLRAYRSVRRLTPPARATAPGRRGLSATRCSAKSAAGHLVRVRVRLRLRLRAGDGIWIGIGLRLGIELRLGLGLG